MSVTIPVSLQSPATSGGSLESLEIDLMLEGIARQYGYDFRQYSPASLRRRIRGAMLKEGVRTVSAMQDLVLHDPAAMLRFVERVAVHTSSMFRDPEVFVVLRREVIPRLRTYPFIRIWHAGCSTGEEVYSLAILLHEEGLYDRSRLYATDLSDGVIERARKRIFPLSAMRDYTIAYQKAGGRENFASYYTTDDKNAVLRKWLGSNVVFSQHNLVCDGPFNEFHLILCRNVMIYFDQTLRARVHQLLHRSLSRFGFLGVGRRSRSATRPSRPISSSPIRPSASTDASDERRPNRGGGRLPGRFGRHRDRARRSACRLRSHLGSDPAPNGGRGESPRRPARPPLDAPRLRARRQGAHRAGARLSRPLELPSDCRVGGPLCPRIPRSGSPALPST